MAITYNAGTNVITVTGYTEGTPCNFTDIYNADVAGAWGVVWRECTKQFCFDCGLIIGDGSTTTWFADSGKQVMHKVFNVPAYSSGYYGAMNVKANANCRFGIVMDATNKLGMNGCHLFYDSTGSYFGVMVEGSGNLSCYSCIFDGGIKYGCGTALNPALTGTFKAWNCMFNTTLYVNKGTTDINKCAMNKKHLANSYGILSTPPTTIENVEIYGTRDRGAMSFTGTSGVTTTKNAYIRDCTNLCVLWGQSATHNVINADTDTWIVYRRSSGSETVQKQFTFDLKVIDKDNGAINGATVKIWDKDSNLIVDTTTNASGVIATETITASICPAGSSTFSTLKTPHLIKIEKAGYTMYEADFTLDEKTDWIIALQTSLLRNPSMGGGMV